MHNLPVWLVDGAEAPATTSRALGLQPRGAEVLERIGALGDLPERSQSLLNMYYNDGPRTVLRLQVGKSAATLPKPTLLVSQAAAEESLRDRFRQLGGKVEWSTLVTGVRQHPDGVTVTVLTGDGAERQLHTGWVVGCDGAHSAVRKAAGIGFAGRELIERLLMVDVRARWPFDHNGSTTWMDTGRMLSITGLPDGVWRVFTEPPPGLPDDLSEDAITDRVLGEFAHRSGTSLDTVEEVRWASEFRIHRRLADTYRRGHVLLTGDAAHIQSPTGGQGQNTGLGDAETLAWKLALVVGGRADPQLLDSYEGERRPLARAVLTATSTAVDVMLPTSRWKRLVRDWLVMPAMRLPKVQWHLLMAASQLGITYRKGSLTPRSRWWSRRPRPGDRVPDVTCRRDDGTTGTLHASISAMWSVLANLEQDATRYADAAAPHLGTDKVQTLVAKQAKPGQVLLIRPDGHVAWRGGTRGGSAEQMAAWLKKTLWPV